MKITLLSREQQHFTQIIFVVQLTKKRALFTSNRGSTVECVFSEAVLSSSIPKKISFFWIGFCARDCFKHSESKWRLLPRLFSEALETGTAPGQEERSNCYQDERSFANLQPGSRFSLTIGWALT